MTKVNSQFLEMKAHFAADLVDAAVGHDPLPKLHTHALFSLQLHGR